VTDEDGLAGFLKARRAALTPAEVGLPATGRRRTPGLRREEVAALAGVSIDYLIRLEQGRDTNPSPSVLAALGSALRLSHEEQRHMVGLAARARSPELCPSRMVANREVTLNVRTLLERVAPTPAFVIGAFADVLAWNEPWERIGADLGLIADEEPNMARYVFLDRRASATFIDWNAAADEQVGALRAAATRWESDPRATALLDELGRVPEFADRWSRHPVEEKRRGAKRLRHPQVGELHITYEVLVPAGDDGQRFVTWFPADDATEAAFNRVSPSRLRIVGD
jgi:transcriptional regulator with XRE-family HTH domain